MNTLTDIFKESKNVYSTVDGEYVATICYSCMTHQNTDKMFIFSCENHYMCFECTRLYYNTSFIENNQCINEKKCFQCFQCRECSCFLIDTTKTLFSKEIVLPDNLTDIDSVTDQEYLSLIAYTKIHDIKHCKKLIEVVNYLHRLSCDDLDKILVSCTKKKRKQTFNKRMEYKLFKLLHNSEKYLKGNGV